jgi:hypothetical protein
VVRGHVHADLHGPDDAPEYDFVAGWQLCAAAVLEGTEEDRACASGSSAIGACFSASNGTSGSRTIGASFWFVAGSSGPRDACSVRRDPGARGSSACDTRSSGACASEEVK